MDFLSNFTVLVSLASAGAPQELAIIRHLQRYSIQLLEGDFRREIPQAIKDQVIAAHKSLSYEKSVPALVQEIALKIRLNNVPQLNVIDAPIEALTRRDLMNVHYIHVDQQHDSWSCAYWGLLNIHAVNDLLRNNLPVNGPSIEERTLERFTRISDRVDHESVFDEEVLEMVRRARLQRTYVMSGCHMENALLTLYPNLDIGNFLLDDGREGEFELFMQQCLAQLRQERNRTTAFHFLCIYPYSEKEIEFVKDGHIERELRKYFHWIVISVVKPPFRKPFVVILDSCNMRFPTFGNGRYLSCIYERLVRPFYPEDRKAK